MGSYSAGLAADAEDCRSREQRNISPALTPYTDTLTPYMDILTPCMDILTPYILPIYPYTKALTPYILYQEAF